MSDKADAVGGGQTDAGTVWRSRHPGKTVVWRSASWRRTMVSSGAASARASPSGTATSKRSTAACNPLRDACIACRATDGCLIEEVFDSLVDARRKLAFWRRDYSNVGPHSPLVSPTPAEAHRELEHLRPPHPARLPNPGGRVPESISCRTVHAAARPPSRPNRRCRHLPAGAASAALPGG
jgi:hypothetical protein